MLRKLRWWIIGYLAAVAVVFLAPLASSSPDGLERVAEDEGFIDKAHDVFSSLIADYSFPGVSNEALATIMGGVVGVTIVYLLVAGGSYLAYRRAAGRRS